MAFWTTTATAQRNKVPPNTRQEMYDLAYRDASPLLTLARAALVRAAWLSRVVCAWLFLDHITVHFKQSFEYSKQNMEKHTRTPFLTSEPPL